MDTLTHAAIKTRIGLYAVIEPAQHHDVICLAHREGHPVPIRGVKGFLQNGVKFLTSVEATSVACKSGQLLWTPQDPSYELQPADIWKVKTVLVDNM